MQCDNLTKNMAEMVNTFSALGDSTRLATSTRLMEGEIALSDLASPLDMSLTAVSKNVNVSPAIVFKAWQTETEFIRWFGATDSRPSAVKLDFRAGGSWRALFGPTDLPETYLVGEYLEIEESTKIVFTWNYVRCLLVAQAYRSPESIVSVTL